MQNGIDQTGYAQRKDSVDVVPKLEIAQDALGPSPPNSPPPPSGVPEPATLALGILGLPLIGAARLLRRKK